MAIKVVPELTAMKAPHGRIEIEQMFGNPARSDGTPNEEWESENIRNVPPPDGWQLFYQADGELVLSSGIRIHKLLDDSFQAILNDIWGAARRRAGVLASNDAIRAWLHERRLDQHGGGFNFRKITGGNELSLHAYGIAIDWDPNNNPRQKPIMRTLPDWWYEIWRVHGWTDGRRFSIPDPMHVQFGTGA